MQTRPIAADLFETEPAPRLIGGRERASGRVVFPLPVDDDRFERITLPDRGTLWSFTIQHIAPKSPPYRGAEPFEPFALGYVELPGACIVESRLVCAAFDMLEVGLPVQTTTTVLRRDEDGTAVLMYAFMPADGPGPAR